MKKCILILSLISAMAISACTPAQNEPVQNDLPLTSGINITVDSETVTPEGASFILLQTTDSEITYGEHYKLQTFRNDIWEDVSPIIENYGFHDIAYLLPKDTPQAMDVNWEWLYGSLPPGEYRFQTDFTDFRGTGDYDSYTLTAAFTIE